MAKSVPTQSELFILNVPPRVTVPVVVIGPPVKVTPLTPPAVATLVTVPP